MKTPVLLAAGIALASATIAVASAGAARGASHDQAALVARGAWLVRLGGCNDCHTPWKLDPKLGIPVQDASRLLSGHPSGAPDPASTLAAPDMLVSDPSMTAFRLAFGTVYAANLTPDKDTGLGTWTQDMFVQTMRTGRHMGRGRPILPPMPWFNLRELSDGDLAAVFAYLRSIPAVHNPVPDAAVAPEALAQMEHAVAALEKAHRP